METRRDSSSPCRPDFGWWKQISIDKYDGASVELQKYLNQFLIVTEGNDWDEAEQGLYLAGSLNGEFCGVLNDLSPSQRKEFCWLKAKLQQRFKPDQVGTFKPCGPEPCWLTV